MTVEPNYRPDYEKHYALMRQWSRVIGPEGARTLLDASLVPDTRLQDIADAWNFYPLARDEMRHSNVTLARLLDALTKEEICDYCLRSNQPLIKTEKRGTLCKLCADNVYDEEGEG